MANLVIQDGSGSTKYLKATGAGTDGDPFIPQNQLRVVATATLSNVSGSASSVTLAASNASRLGLMIFNDSTVALYVKFGATASTTSFTVKMAAASYYEIPRPLYTGVIDGIWDSATGSARVTELT